MNIFYIPFILDFFETSNLREMICSLSISCNDPQSKPDKQCFKSFQIKSTLEKLESSKSFSYFFITLDVGLER